MPPSNTNNWKTDPEYTALLNYLIEITKNAKSPISVSQLARDYKEKSGAAQTETCLLMRIRSIRTIIRGFKHIDTESKIKMMFALSASVNAGFLKELKEGALVEVDDKQRIIHYKANDGSLKLRGVHSPPAKTRMFRNYFEIKNNADAVPKNEKEKEIWNLVEFITEKCVNVDTPLSVYQLATAFDKRFGMSRTFDCIYYRINEYCHEIQNTEFMDTHSKVRQLFGLSGTLDSNFLKELREDAVVEVDDQNRITKYTANDGRLTLHGDHSSSTKKRLGRIKWEKKRNAVKNACNSGSVGEKVDQNENDHSEDDSDEYSREEFDSIFKSDDENGHQEMLITNSFDFISPTERSHPSEETEMRVDEENAPKIMENAVIKTRSGRSSKRRHLDSNFSYDLENSNSSEALISSSSSYSKPAIPEKKRNKGKTGFISSKRTGSFSNNTIRPNEIDDYDSNYSIENQVKLEPFRGSIQEDLTGIEEDEDIQQIPRPSQALDEHNQIEEVTIKVEQEESVGNSTEPVEVKPVRALHEQNELMEVPIKSEHEEAVEVKPETSHNSKIKFFEAMQSLILCVGTPSLSFIQLKIQQKIQKLEGSDEVILNNEIIQIIELLVARLINQSVENHSKNVKSMNLSNFLCYLKAAVLNSKMSGVEGLVKNISELIEESQNKITLMENVANALRITLVTEYF